MAGHEDITISGTVRQLACTSSLLRAVTNSPALGCARETIRKAWNNTYVLQIPTHCQLPNAIHSLQIVSLNIATLNEEAHFYIRVQASVFSFRTSRTLSTKSADIPSALIMAQRNKTPTDVWSVAKKKYQFTNSTLSTDSCHKSPRFLA